MRIRYKENILKENSIIITHQMWRSPLKIEDAKFFRYLQLESLGQLYV